MRRWSELFAWMFRTERLNPSKIHIPESAIIRFGDQLVKKTPDAE